MNIVSFHINPYFAIHIKKRFNDHTSINFILLLNGSQLLVIYLDDFHCCYLQGLKKHQTILKHLTDGSNK